MKYYVLFVVTFKISTIVYSSETSFERNLRNSSDKPLATISDRDRCGALDEFNQHFSKNLKDTESEISIFEKNMDITIQILSFLSLKDLISFTKTNHENNKILSNESSNTGNILKKEFKFSVIDIHGKIYFLEEYLALSHRTPINNIKDVLLIVVEKPRDFVKVILKSSPHTPDTIASDLQDFYEDKLNINTIVNRLPSYSTNHEKLVAFFVQYEAWSQIIRRVILRINDIIVTQVWRSIEGLIGSPSFFDFWDDIENRVGNHLCRNVWNQVRNQVNDLIWDDIWGPLWKNLEEQVWQHHIYQADMQISRQITSDLSNFNFATSNAERVCPILLKKASDYVMMVYQLATISTMYSDDFRKIIEDPENCFTKYIKDHITEEQAVNILTNIQIPEIPRKDFLVKTQLDILKKYQVV